MKSGDIVIYKSEVGTVVTDYDNREVMRFYLATMEHILLQD